MNGTQGRVTNVIHLAAQAGVRYSLKKPLAYVEANVKCFVTRIVEREVAS